MNVNLQRGIAAVGVIVASGTMTPTQPALADVTQVRIPGCPKGHSIQVVEEDLGLPAPQVNR